MSSVGNTSMAEAILQELKVVSFQARTTAFFRLFDDVRNVVTLCCFFVAKALGVFR
jgi:hypothetical protein